MKRVINIALSLFILFFVFSSVSYAQESDATSGGIFSTSTESASTDYALAYPGILPDNPLYFLKAARDRIIGLLINDTVKKAEFSILTSDKRLYAAILLLDKGKQKLAISTLSKSNNYLDEALKNAAQAKSTGKNVDTVLSSLQSGLKKRDEVIISMRGKIPEDMRDAFEAEAKRLENLEKEAIKLSSK